jgi:1-aminocyclopropane-1-carboxylate deaminase/D-cysteine desulfhydrase-like pyridoxal-dependent ACC family enzyme/biotin carboxylase
MKKLVIIGANEFQNPLILKAKEMGCETHVFAWKDGAVGEKNADYFYPISITEVDQILEVCKKIQPDGVTTIGSDLANITAARLADKLGLPGNDLDCIEKSTNKAAMRKAFCEARVSVPFFRVVDRPDALNKELEKKEITFPVIVKPTDRSGSRAITKVEAEEELAFAIEKALEQSFEKKAIVEGYITGSEYSMESISYQGKHTCLAITKKFTTGAPHYIETGHLQPALLADEMRDKCIREVQKALDALDIKNGASHAEFKIDPDGEVRIIEIGSRMGGDCIGSDLVPLSTGHDFVKMVVQTALGVKPEICTAAKSRYSAIRFVFDEEDAKRLEYIKETMPTVLQTVEEPEGIGEHPVVDSGSRYGFYIMQTDTMEEMEKALYGHAFTRKLPLWETPIQELYGLKESGNHFFMKRDDLLGYSFGGNKVRFAEQFFEDMERKNCDSMIIYGNYHSNLCRILSAACAREKIPCYMIYNVDDIQENIQKNVQDSLHHNIPGSLQGEASETGNSKLISRQGVVSFPCHKGAIAPAVASAMESLKEAGHKPYYIYGDIYGEGNETVPMKAYVKAYQEICRQEEKMKVKFDYIFLASSTNATQSGLIAGKLLHAFENDDVSDTAEKKSEYSEYSKYNTDGPQIVGISVSRNQARGRQVILKNVRTYLAQEGRQIPENLEKDIQFEDKWLAGGYGVYGDDIEEVIWQMYDENGIALDPVYTGKGFYGMLQYLKQEKIQGKNILFLHTGGTPLFFDYMGER